jgi:hypothetical protein
MRGSVGSVSPLRVLSRRVAVVLYALLPFFGVTALGWRAADVITYYWAANVAYVLTEWRFMKLAWASEAGSTAVLSPSEPSSSLPATKAPAGATTDGTEVIFINGTPVEASSEAIIRAGLAPQLGSFFVFFVMVASLVQLGFLHGSNYVSWGAIAPAIVLQGIRRLLMERSESVARLRRRVIPVLLIGRVAALHLVVLLLPTTAPRLVVLALCALVFVAERLTESYGSGRPELWPAKQ